MAPKTPPQAPPSFVLTPSSLILEAHSIISTTKALEDRLAASIAPETATFSNLVVPLTADDTAHRARTSILTLPASVSPDATLRDAAREAQVLLSKACTESLARLEIATLVAAVHRRYKAGEEDLDPESGHLLERTYGQYARNGLTLGEGEKRARFLEMKEDLQGVLTAAKRTLTEADDAVWLTRAELDGVPDSVLAQLEREDRDGVEMFRVTFRQGHYRPVMQNATRADTRRRMYLGDAHRFPENVERLESAVRLRDEIARILGYENHAALRMEDKMSESVDEVLELLGDVKTRLAPLADAEIEGMLALKRDDLRERGGTQEKEDVELHFWDWAFYNRKLKRERYAVDTARIAEYFEVENTLRGMLSIFERLFGLEFRREGECEAWHEDVVLYTVWDSEEQGGEFLGYLYMDIFARAGKYAGAHHVSIVPVSSHFPPQPVRFLRISNLDAGDRRKPRVRTPPVPGLRARLQLQQAVRRAPDAPAAPGGEDALPRAGPRDPLPRLADKVRHGLLARLRRDPEHRAGELDLGARRAGGAWEALQSFG